MTARTRVQSGQTVVRTTVNTFAVMKRSMRVIDAALHQSQACHRCLQRRSRVFSVARRVGGVANPKRSAARFAVVPHLQLVTPSFLWFPSLASPNSTGGPATLPHIATMEDEADTPTEQRPLVARGTTRYGRAAVAGPPSVLGPPALRADDAHKPSGSDGSPADGRPLLRRRDRETSPRACRTSPDMKSSGCAVRRYFIGGPRPVPRAARRC